MFPSHSPQQASIATQLAEELAAYQARLGQYLEHPGDADGYRELSDRFDRMQTYASALPEVGRSFSELLISRVELLHAIWDGCPARIAAERERHAEVIRTVMRKSVRYITVPWPNAQGDGESPAH